MRKYRNGFSLAKGTISLLIVLAIATTIPIVVDQIADNNKIQKAENSDAESCLFESLYNQYMNSNAAYARLVEPIILDLTGRGVSATSLKKGIFFDYNNDGFAEKIAWAQDGNAVLCADLNNNGKIDNGTELVTGFQLASFDTNSDGIIDKNDKIFNTLKLMKNDGKIMSLSNASVKSIDITVTPCDITDENGNNKFAYGSYTQENGKVSDFGEYNLVTDFSNSKDKNIVKESKSITTLPDISNRGILHSLRQTMQRDEKLVKLVSDFVNEQNDEKRTVLVSKIMQRWSQTEDVKENSRGKYVNAKHLAIVEAFMGRKFVGVDDKSSNPNFKAADLIEQVYVNLENYVYAELMKQSHLADLYKAIVVKKQKYDFTRVVNKLEKELKSDSEKGKNRVLQFAKMVKGLGFDYQSNFLDPKNENCYYFKFTKDDRNLKYKIDSIAKVPFDIKNARIINNEIMGTAAGDAFQVKNKNDKDMHVRLGEGDDVIYGDEQTNIFVGCLGNDILDGGAGDDILFANQGNDIIYGGEGDDRIYAGEDDDVIFGGDGNDLIYPDNNSETEYDTGNDTIVAGRGNDTIYSYLGDDTYIFNLGDGQDIIFEKQGQDTLYFGKGIKWTDLLFEQSNNDMIIKIKNTNDQITVKDWFVAVKSDSKVNLNNQIEEFEFADGTKHTIKEIKNK